MKSLHLSSKMVLIIENFVKNSFEKPGIFQQSELDAHVANKTSADLMVFILSSTIRKNKGFQTGIYKSKPLQFL